MYTETQAADIPSDGPPRERITAQEAAERAGVTRQAVSRFLGRRPILRGADGLVDAATMAEALATLKASPKHQAQPKAPPRRGPKPNRPPAEIVAASATKITADARKAEASANRAEIAAAREAGALIDRQAVIETTTAVIAAARNKLLRLPDLLADELANADAETVHRTMTARIHGVLRDLARIVSTYDDPASAPVEGDD